MLSYLLLPACYIVLIAFFIVLNRMEWGSPRLPLIGLFLVVASWCVVGVYHIATKLLSAYKDQLIINSEVCMVLILSILPLLLVAIFIIRLQQFPHIHDISTDVKSPPAFHKATVLRHASHNTTEYPPSNIPQQQQAYSHIQPLVVALPPNIVFSHIRVLIEKKGWIIHQADLEQGIIEASVRTAIFGFIDDVVIRVVANEGEAGKVLSRIDVRSASRVGVSDLGANAKRIDDLLRAVEQQIAE